MELPNSYWDKLALRYPRYADESIQRDAQFIFGVARGFGVDFDGKTILDIGCGTGTLAIPLASKASKITALDLSQAMLDIFEYDKKTIGLEQKIDIHQSSWDEFDIKDRFDISLASMTPAVSTYEQIDKFLASSKEFGIFVGWGSYKNNDLVDEILLSCQISKNKAFGQAQRFEEYIKSKNIKYTIEYFETSWSDSYNLDDAKEYLISHIQRFDITLEEDFIEEFLLSKIQDNKITFNTQAQKGVVVFKM